MMVMHIPVPLFILFFSDVSRTVTEWHTVMAVNV